MTTEAERLATRLEVLNSNGNRREAAALLRKLQAENEALRVDREKRVAELRCISMDYGMAGNIEGVDAANYCADHLEAAIKGEPHDPA